MEQIVLTVARRQNTIKAVFVRIVTVHVLPAMEEAILIVLAALDQTLFNREAVLVLVPQQKSMPATSASHVTLHARPVMEQDLPSVLLVSALWFHQEVAALILVELVPT